jgi:hypothetical protein
MLTELSLMPGHVQGELPPSLSECYNLRFLTVNKKLISNATHIGGVARDKLTLAVEEVARFRIWFQRRRGQAHHDYRGAHARPQAPLHMTPIVGDGEGEAPPTGGYPVAGLHWSCPILRDKLEREET